MIGKVLSKHFNFDYTEVFEFPDTLIFLEKCIIPEKFSYLNLNF
jgi:hypothetical protein